MGKSREELQVQRSSGLNDFKQIAPLGEGAYSSVYKVVRLADKAIYALKKVKLPSLSDKEKQNALNEVRLLASVRHENVIAYKEAFWDDKTRSLCIVTEFADAGDLFQQIVRHQRNRTHFREEDVWRYLLGMCSGLKALHDMRVLHRDLKCANVFLSNGEGGRTHAKLGDFNVSKVAKRGLCMTQTGTPYYASPEVWRDMPYDAKSDMWSLGCVLYEVCALRPPFRADDMEALYRKVLRGQYPRIPAIYSQDLTDVIASLLQVNPRHRPSVDELIDSPLVKHKQQELQEQLKSVPQGQEVTGISDLLRTIPLPRDAGGLVASLPEPRYDLIEMSFNKDPAEAERSERDRQEERPASFASARGGGGNRSPGQEEIDDRNGGRHPPQPQQEDPRQYHRSPQREQRPRDNDAPRDPSGAPRPPRQRPPRDASQRPHREPRSHGGPEDRPRPYEAPQQPPRAMPPAPSAARRGSREGSQDVVAPPIRDRGEPLPHIPHANAQSPAPSSVQLPPLLNAQAHRQPHRRPPPPSGGSRQPRIPQGSTRLPSIGVGNRRG